MQKSEKHMWKEFLVSNQEHLLLLLGRENTLWDTQPSYMFGSKNLFLGLPWWFSG